MKRSIAFLSGFFLMLMLTEAWAAPGPAQTTTARSRATDPYYVQKVQTSTFDDLVRYKTRTQMQTTDDPQKFRYLGPQAAVAFGDHVELFNYQCGRLEAAGALSNSGSDTHADPRLHSARIVFTPRNTHLFVYGAVTGPCSLYPVNGTQLGAAVTAQDAIDYGNNVDACRANMTTLAASKNGYMIMGFATGTKVSAFQFDGTKYRALAPIVSAPTFAPTIMSMTGDGRMFIAAGSTALNKTIYARGESDRYYPIGVTGSPWQNIALPSGFAALVIYNAAFSPDGRYLATASFSAGTVRIHIWRIGADSQFTALSSSPITLVPGGTQARVSAFTFSPDSKYLAIAGSDASFANSYIQMFRVEDGDSFIPVTVNATNGRQLTLGGFETAPATRSVSAIAFAPDSSYMLVSLAYTGTNAARQPLILPINQISPLVWGAYSSEQQQWTGTYMPKMIAIHH